MVNAHLQDSILCCRRLPIEEEWSPTVNTFLFLFLFLNFFSLFLLLFLINFFPDFNFFFCSLLKLLFQVILFLLSFCFLRTFFLNKIADWSCGWFKGAFFIPCEWIRLGTDECSVNVYMLFVKNTFNVVCCNVLCYIIIYVFNVMIAIYVYMFTCFIYTYFLYISFKVLTLSSHFLKYLNPYVKFRLEECFWEPSGHMIGAERL